MTSSLRHIRDGQVLIGILWREWSTAGWIWMAETPMGRLRDFPTEGTAEAWLWQRWRATLGPAWAATVDARALGDAA